MSGIGFLVLALGGALRPSSATDVEKGELAEPRPPRSWHSGAERRNQRRSEWTSDRIYVCQRHRRCALPLPPLPSRPRLRRQRWHHHDLCRHLGGRRCIPLRPRHSHPRLRESPRRRDRDGSQQLPLAGRTWRPPGTLGGAQAARHGLATLVGFMSAGVVPLAAYLIPMPDAAPLPGGDRTHARLALHRRRDARAGHRSPLRAKRARDAARSDRSPPASHTGSARWPPASHDPRTTLTRARQQRGYDSALRLHRWPFEPGRRAGTELDFVSPR